MNTHRRPQTSSPRYILPVLAVVVVFVIIIGSSSRTLQPVTAQAATLAPAPYRAASPHWSHIDIADWGTLVRLLDNSTARQEAFAWYAAHVDTMSIAMDTFAYRADRADAPMLKTLNPTFKVFGSDIDQYMCNHMGCWDTHEPNETQSNLPEEYYLHFSQNTHIDFFDIDGTTAHGSVDIPGCPEPGPITAACRVKFYDYAQDTVWVPNSKNSDWQVWFANQILDHMTTTAGNSNQIDALFLDGHGPGFSASMQIGVQNKITLGGTIREYGGQIPIQSTWVYDSSTETWGPSFTELDLEYSNDMSSWLSYLHSRLAAQNKSIRINIGDNITPPITQQQTSAANGAMTEHLNKATNPVLGAHYYQTALRQIRSIAANGGTIDLAGSVCDNGPVDFPKGNYPTGLDRYRMWALANYYMMKQAPTEHGIVYFDPGLCLDRTTTTPAQDLSSQWLAAYEVDVGQPIGEPVVVKHGSLACDSQGYNVYSRRYANALVIVRPPDSWDCHEYGDNSIVTIPLETPMSMLKADGTLSDPMSTVNIRNAEAVILFPVPDSTAPSSVSDLRAE